MKVLQLNTVCGRGSTGRIATDLLSYLKANGHEGKIAYGIPPALGIAEGEGFYTGSKSDYYVHNILSRLTDCEGRFSKSATRELVKQIAAYSPDIIHLHNLHGHWVNYEILFDYLSKTTLPVIWTLHDCWPFTGHCSSFDAIGCEQWKNSCLQCSQKESYPQSWFRDNCKKNFDCKKAAFTKIKKMTIVTPSEWLANIVRESMLGKYPIQVINNGIDTDRFHYSSSSFAEKNGLLNRKIVLGVAGVWTQQKGLKDFYCLAEKLDKEYVVVLVGLTKEQCNCLPLNMVGVQRTNSIEELADIYSQATVFVNMTYQDNYPTVNLEALACSTPVITYRTGGSIEAINNENGVVVEQGDIEGVIDAIKRVDMFDREYIASQREQYSANNRYCEYIDLYKHMIGR